jgi:hypothetical protein
MAQKTKRPALDTPTAWNSDRPGQAINEGEIRLTPLASQARAALRIALNFRLTPAVARTVVELSGLGGRP